MHVPQGIVQSWKRMALRSERPIELGVPAGQIVLETQSTNIGENLRFSRSLLESRGIIVDSLIMVSKPSTERRMHATCAKVWPEVRASVASPTVDLSEQMSGGIGDGLIHEMVGDIQRIQQYPSLGFQISQFIPDEVWQAYERLIEKGFNKHLLPTQQH